MSSLFQKTVGFLRRSASLIKKTYGFFERTSKKKRRFFWKNFFNSLKKTKTLCFFFDKLCFLFKEPTVLWKKRSFFWRSSKSVSSKKTAFFFDNRRFLTASSQKTYGFLKETWHFLQSQKCIRASSQKTYGYQKNYVFLTWKRLDIFLLCKKMYLLFQRTFGSLNQKNYVFFERTLQKSLLPIFVKKRKPVRRKKTFGFWKSQEKNLRFLNSLWYAPPVQAVFETNCTTPLSASFRTFSTFSPILFNAVGVASLAPLLLLKISKDIFKKKRSA